MPKSAATTVAEAHPAGATATDLNPAYYHDAVPVELDWFTVGDVGLEVRDDARGGRGAILGGAAARLAAHGAAQGMKVAIAGKVGDDEMGAQVLQQLRTLGIDLRWFRQSPELRTTVWHEPRDHPESWRLERGADHALRLDELPSPVVARARLTVVSGFSLSVEPARSAAVWALETAQRRGGRSALLLEADRLWSTNARMTRRVLEPALAAADTVALNADDMRALLGPRMTAEEAARSIAQAGPRVVYLEDGEGGVVLYESGRAQALASRPHGAPADRFAGPAAFWAGLAGGTAPRKAALTAIEYTASIRRAGAPRHPVHL